MVTRELSEYADQVDFCRFGVTSLKPVNPDNAPDTFEQRALLRFEKGETEVIDIFQDHEGYPGNTRSEEGYGQIHKVLKGSEDGSTEAVFARRFMSPNQLNPQVGFRCVKDQP